MSEEERVGEKVGRATHSERRGAPGGGRITQVRNGAEIMTQREAVS